MLYGGNQLYKRNVVSQQSSLMENFFGSNQVWGRNVVWHNLRGTLSASNRWWWPFRDVTYILLLPTIHCLYNGFFNKEAFKSTLRAEQSLQMLSLEIRKPALHIPPIGANQSPSIWGQIHAFVQFLVGYVPCIHQTCAENPLFQTLEIALIFHLFR